MDNVANESAATGLSGFLQKAYKPIYAWANRVFATKEDIAAIEGAKTAEAEVCESIIDELI